MAGGISAFPAGKDGRSSRAERIRRDRPCRDAAASARPPRGSPPAFHPPARREACIRSARPPRGRRANRTPARGQAARLFRAEGAGCPRRQEYPDLPCRLSSHFLRTNRPMGRKYPVLPRGSAHFWADRETPQAHPSGGPAPQPARGGNWGAAAGGRGGAPPALPVPLQNRRFCAPAGAARSAGGRCFSRSVPAPGSAAAAGSAARAAPARRKEAPRALRRGRQARRPRRCGRCRAGGRAALTRSGSRRMIRLSSMVSSCSLLRARAGRQSRAALPPSRTRRSALPCLSPSGSPAPGGKELRRGPAPSRGKKWARNSRAWAPAFSSAGAPLLPPAGPKVPG